MITINDQNLDKAFKRYKRINTVAHWDISKQLRNQTNITIKN